MGCECNSNKKDAREIVRDSYGKIARDTACSWPTGGRTSRPTCSRT